MYVLLFGVAIISILVALVIKALIFDRLSPARGFFFKTIVSGFGGFGAMILVWVVFFAISDLIRWVSR